MQRVAEAIEKARSDHPAPYKTSLPMPVKVRMRFAAGAEAAAAKPGARQADEHSVRWRVERQCDVVKGTENAGLDEEVRRFCDQQRQTCGLRSMAAQCRPLVRVPIPLHQIPGRTAAAYGFCKQRGKTRFADRG